MAVNVDARRGSNTGKGSPEMNRTGPARGLIHRCAAGEEQAWRELYGQYYPTAFRFLRRLGVPRHEMEDACQEVFVQVFRYLGRFDQRADLATWLYRLCITQAHRLRRRDRLAAGARWLVKVIGILGASTVEPGWSDGFMAMQIRRALDRVKPHHRDVLVMYEFEGLACDDIARILECPPTTVRRRLHYGRQELERLLEGSGHEH